MKLKCAFLLGAVAYCALAVSAEQESKYNEIIKLLSDSDQQLKPAAQSYSASVVDPNDYSSSSSSGYSRGSSERSRYSPSSSSSSSKNQDDDDKKLEEDEEENKKPDRLAILLADSKFTCENLKNGYYADETVGCQVFHYCVDGVKHSWQCPENTVFHQIHLNCVPNTQDICGQSSKFHVVNDFLHKELNERGPNNSVLYAQRFYPEGFDLHGDTVTQIFQAQAAASLQRARERDQESSSDYEDEPRPAPRRPKPSYTASTQSVRPQPASRPAYKPASRPIAATYAPPAPTKRPVTYTTPEAYTPPSYTESSNDDYSSDFSPSSGSSSASSGASPSFSSSSNLGSSSYSSGASVASSYSPSSQASPSSFSSSSHSSHSQPSSSYRPSSRPSSYPSRSLGIPIASFRVAPSSGSGYSSVGAQASNIQEVNVPFNQGGFYF